MLKWLKNIWVRLTWIHIVSVKRGDGCPFEEGVWYTCSYQIKMRGSDMIINDVRVNRIGDEQV